MKIDDAIDWPVIPTKQDYAPVTYADPYVEGYARCLEDCKKAARKYFIEDGYCVED